MLSRVLSVLRKCTVAGKVTAVQLSTDRVCRFAYVISRDPRSVKWALLPRPSLEKGLRSSVRPEAPLRRYAFEILPCL